VAEADVAPFIRDGEIYVPLSHLAELAGAEIDRRAETMTVIIRK